MSAPLRLPSWSRTIRARLALTYSSVLFTIAALLLIALNAALSFTIEAEPLDPVTVEKFHLEADGSLDPKSGEIYLASDFASIQRAVNYQTLQILQTYSLVAVLVLFAVSLAVGWWVAGRALRPIEAITRTAQEISATDLSRRIAATGPHDELRTLADTIDRMLERLDRTFRTERALLEDVSHELRNPVATIQANVEAVLADDDASTLQRQEATAVVLRATNRMTRLLEDLLATARRRSEAFTDADVHLVDVVEHVTEEYSALAARRGLELRATGSGDPVVSADPEALTRALGNLVSNAVRLAPSGSAIVVDTGTRDGWAWAAVADRGPGIPESQRNQVFDRFRRDVHRPGPEVADRPGSGLGLSIARQIVESHRGRLRLHGRTGGGSVFVIWLPEGSSRQTGERSVNPPEDDPCAI